jgi:hypothetical protein
MISTRADARAPACEPRARSDPAKPSSAAAIDPTVTAMWSQERNVRSLARNVLGSTRIGVVRAMGGAVAVGADRPPNHHPRSPPPGPSPPSSRPPPSRGASNCRVGASPRSGWVRSSPPPRRRGLAARAGAAPEERDGGASSAGAGADWSMEGRTLSSSTQ